MEGTQCKVGVGVQRLQGNRGFQCVLDAAAQTLCQCPAHADALAVAAQGIGQQVVGIGVVGFAAGLCGSALGHPLVEFQALAFPLFQVHCVNAGRLVGHRGTGRAQPQASAVGVFKLAVVK